MASFEQNQQDQVNMNNTLNQIKQFNAECDKATAAMRAADLEAEEELLGVRLKNLTKAQQTKLTQLSQLLELEEKGIQELAKLKLTLSNRQFAIRKQEIQKEFQLYKAEAENFFKSISKYKVTMPTEAPKKASTKNKSADAAIQKADRKVQTATYSVDKLRQAITGATSSMRELVEATSAATAQKKAQPAQKQATTDSKTGSENSTSTKVKVEAQREQNFSNDSKGMERAEEHKFGFTDIIPALDAIKAAQEAAAKDGNKVFDFSSVINELNNLHDKGESGSSQATLDFAGELVDQAKKADKSIIKLREFNENKEHNLELIQLTEEQRLNKEYADKEYKLAEDSAKRKAQLDFIEAHRKELIDQNLEELRGQHAAEEIQRRQEHNKELARAIQLREDENSLLADDIKKFADARTKKHNDLTDEARGTKAEYTDIKDNEGDYRDIARQEHENAFYAERNRLLKESFAIEEGIAWNSAHRKELLDQEEQKERLGYLKEYQELQADGFSHLTENMSKEEFAALRAETAATEKAIEARGKISTANEKALATLRNKGTLQEKKDLLKAQIKERAAEKDWSKPEKKDKKEASEFSKSLDGLLKKSKITAGIADKASQLKMKADEKANKRFDELFKPKITDDMSDEDKKREEERVQKNKEKAAAAEMALNAATSALADFAQKLSQKTDDIAKVQGVLDTRLQGSRENEMHLLSYGKQLQKEAKWIAGASPYIKQEKLVENITALVNKGISFDVKQRAFLMTVQEKIANTFDVADGTLLRLIRIQQQDTTAGRLGMESALNSFLNSMYETSEYLESVAANVRGSLEEMQALMEGKAATEIEYQVQKWMGSLYSVGMSDSAVQDIAKTLGQVASGDISGLTGSGTGNLLIMAANEAGMSIADILQAGLNADETNKLMQAMVNYLAEIAETSSDSRVVQQQLANVYGLKASDLKAVTNLASSLKDVSKADMSYGGMMGQLNLMMNTLALRTSMGEGISNMWNNIEYTMATSMATNPISYLLPKLSKMLKDTTGGIDLPFVNVMGFGVDLNTSVADLMSVAAMAPAVLGSLGPVLAGLTDLVNPLAGTTMMMRAGINPFGKVPVLARGSAPVLQTLGGTSISESGHIGNASGDDIKNQTLQGAEDDKKKQMVEAKDEESAVDTAMKADLAVVNIYNLLEEVAHGSQSLRVRVINNNATGGSYGGNSYNGSNNVIGDSSGNGVTGAGANSGGGDNGNWVLSV